MELPALWITLINICLILASPIVRPTPKQKSMVYNSPVATNFDEHYHSPPLVLPIQNEREWKPANLSTIHCPDSSHLGPDEHRTIETWLVSRPKEQIKNQIKGYLCHKARWITRCEYTWYFSKTVSRKIEPLPPIELECKEAFSKKEEGLLLRKGFPPAECYWAGTNDEYYDQVDVSDHPATYDPYKDGVTDSVFIGGQCKKRVCETVHDSTLWIEVGTDSRPPACTFDEEEQLELVSGIKGAGGAKQKVQHSVFVVGTNYPFMDAKGACKFRYCGKDGMLLQNGLWFNILHTIRADGESEVGFWAALQPCSGDRTIGVLGEEFEIEALEATIEDILWDLECFKTLEDIIHHKRISLLDLFRLSRLTPGVGPAYTIKGETLFSKEVDYVKAVKISDVEEPSASCAAHYTKSNGGSGCIKYTDFDSDGERKGHVMNGIMVIDGKVKLPHQRFHLRRWDPEFILKHSIHKVQHPVLGNLTTKIHDSIEEGLIKDHSANAGEVIGGWVQVATSKVSWFFKEIEKFVLAFVITLILILLFLMCMKMKKKEPRKSKHDESSGDEMVTKNEVF
uniref:Glycoprotein n=1 Tax=Suncus murinus rhabdovirus TaxID=3139574 RepID=A0AB38ZKA7_9RHAB